jgi:hypothetical protein
MFWQSLQISKSALRNDEKCQKQDHPEGHPKDFFPRVYEISRLTDDLDARPIRIVQNSDCFVEPIHGWICRRERACSCIDPDTWQVKRYFDHGQKLALALTIMARIDIMAMTTCQGLPKLGSGT